MAVFGEWLGNSLLFPMEQLFERYVEMCLRRSLPWDATLRSQASTEYLCEHRGTSWFQLKPDMIVESAGRRWILDAKWKLLDQNLDSTRDKYGLSQSDLYQLFSYGERYLAGSGDMFLVFPKTEKFDRPLPPFSFSGALRLWVVPFDLEIGELVLDNRIPSWVSLPA